MSEISKFLKLKLYEYGTYHELAKRIGISQTTVFYKIKYPDRYMHAKTLEKIIAFSDEEEIDSAKMFKEIYAAGQKSARKRTNGGNRNRNSKIPGNRKG